MDKKPELDSFKKTKYWKYMISKIDEIDRERISFNTEYLALLNNSTDEMALVLKCHLIIEHYIDQYITVAFPSIIDIEKMNLRFATKIEMINNPNTFFGFYYKSLKQFNKLRNKFAHDLEYKIKNQDIEEMIRIMNAWNDAGGYTRTEGTELVKQYSMWLSSSLHATMNIIKKETKELGISGYIKWMKKMNTEEILT